MHDSDLSKAEHDWARRSLFRRRRRRRRGPMLVLLAVLLAAAATALLTVPETFESIISLEPSAESSITIF